MAKGTTRRESQPDWAGNGASYALAWGMPSLVLVAGLVADVTARPAIWTAALLWMGIACLLNARRCGRRHCRYTGPFYLLMILPVAAAAAGLIAPGQGEWLALAVVIVVGGKIIWWASERHTAGPDD